MERVKALRGTERAHYDLTGELPQASTPAPPAESPTAPDVPAESSPDAEKGPDAAPGTTTTEHTETDKSRKARERNAARWDELIEERGRLKAENELLRKQTAPGAAPKAPAVEAPTMPSGAPRLKDYDKFGEEAVPRWETDLIKWTEAQRDSAITTAVSFIVSSRVGQVTFLSSAMTSCINVTGVAIA